MAQPEIKIVAVSNVYSRLMHFVNKGDVEFGHSHTYDHATILSTGSVLYEILDGFKGTAVSAKEFKAPGYIFVEKNKFHRITALEDNTVCTCVHALRTITEDIIPPDSLINPLYSATNNDFEVLATNKTGEKWKPIIHTTQQKAV